MFRFTRGVLSKFCTHDTVLKTTYLIAPHIPPGRGWEHANSTNKITKHQRKQVFLFVSRLYSFVWKHTKTHTYSNEHLYAQTSKAQK